MLVPRSTARICRVVRRFPIPMLIFRLVVICCVAAVGLARAAASSPDEVFARRILPIFQSPDPSSCVQCHLSGVDLKNYLRPTHEESFLSLRDQGLIDLEKPRASKILRLIAMKEEDKPGAELIHEKVRQLELEAFTEWIEASARDPRLRAAPKLAQDALAKPERPNDVIRHGRTDKLLERFEQTIWAQRFRCTGCHMPGSTQNAKLVAEHGEEEMNWLVPNDAEATMRALIASELINTQEPERSLLLRKPLGEVKHGGGKKMVRGDLGYKAWRSWIDDFAKVARNRYTQAADLPRSQQTPAAFPSEIWLKLVDTPPEWAERLLQVTVFAWDAASGSWEAEPIAVSDRPVWGKGKLWQHNLLLLAGAGTERARGWAKTGARLDGGRYLIRVHVDRTGRLAAEWEAPMSDVDLVGSSVVESKWPAGYGAMTVVDAGSFR